MQRFVNLIFCFICTIVLTACSSKGTIVTSGEYTDEQSNAEYSSADSQGNEEDNQAAEEYKQDTEKDNQATDYTADEKECIVYVCGAVNNPDVYSLPGGAIKKDALMAAGGFTDGAALDYVNLAEGVSDGEKIYFPYEDELADGIIVAKEDETDGLININTAGSEQLMTLPGIGEKKAQDIIDYREEQGNFKNIEDIKNVNGIKESIYNKIKDKICVVGSVRR